MQLQFRLAAHHDIDLLVEFMRQFYAIDNYDFKEPIARRGLQELIDDPSLGRLWLILKADRPIGYMALVFGYSLEYHGRGATLDELFITADQRGQGMGTQAIQFLIEACRELGLNALHLEVERANIAGQRLYRKFGFKDYDSRYLMTKMLDE
ncbi:MAG TPA: GNAT family N-acetyltransferase [Ktedonosporobacter sp.]|nr:GNAT family N-acetyltransferase [Ktedonosporobacter sp.]